MQVEDLKPTTTSPVRTATLTVVTMIAFAANSVLCRLALGDAQIDAASFTTIRLVSGALTLWLLMAFRSGPGSVVRAGSWNSAFMLFLYAVAFSFAYITLDVGTGALILFGAVQLTMILAGIRAGERPGLLEWLGLVIAGAGLIYLMFPGITAPSTIGAALMAIAGVAWGIYSLQGRGASDPIAATAGNFVRSVPMVLAVSLAMLSKVDLSTRSIVFAVLSGALASGLGYVIWYAALPGLTATRAAMVQLSVPVIAAAGGVLFVAEEVSVRLILSSALVLSGVALAVTAGQRHAPTPK